MCLGKIISMPILLLGYFVCLLLRNLIPLSFKTHKFAFDGFCGSQGKCAFWLHLCGVCEAVGLYDGFHVETRLITVLV